MKDKKPETYIDNLGRKITVHYFNSMAQYEYEGKRVQQVVSQDSLRMKMEREKWKPCN